MRVKKLLCSILAICMILSTMGTAVFAVEEPEAPVLDMIATVSDEYPTENWIDSADTTWYTEGETSYTISTAAELAGLAKLVSDGTAFCDKNFNSVAITLDADIDLDGRMWTPIGGGEENKTFAGIFDGDNHKISNVTVISSYGNVGLFGRCAMNADFGISAEVKNFTVENAVVKASGKDGVGAAVGYGHTELKVDNVNVTGVIDVLGYRGVAAVVGKGYADIYNCTVKAEGTIAAQYWCAGGILGHSDENCNEILNCKVISVGNGLTIDGGSYNGAGGIAGYIKSGSTVKDAAIEGVTITGDYYYYGGYACGNGYTAENVKVSNVKLMAGGNEITNSHDAEAVEVCVAEVDGEYYADFVSALKAIEEDSIVNLLADVTYEGKWDCRYTGSKTTVPYTLNGNGHTLKIKGEINDGYNHLTVFRPEAEATFMNLTVDMSEAISVFQNRFSAISTNGCDLTVDGCTFIGSTTYTKARAIIFGEGGTADDEAVISVTNSQFTNWLYGVVDNMNGVDVAKSVTIDDSTFSNAGIQISAADEVALTDNTVEGAYVSITSYSDMNELSVVATGNTLEESADGKVNFIAAKDIVAQEGFVLPSVDVDGKKYFDLQTAINKSTDGATITLLDDVKLVAQDANSELKPAYNRESYAGLIIPDDKEVTIDLNGKTISYVDEYFECDNLAIINLGNLTINDSVGGGKITYKPVVGSTTYSKFYSTIFNCGTLTVNGGIIENTCDTATDVTNAVDNHSRLSHEYDNDSVLVVNGGTLIGSEYRAIRQYTHYFEGVKNRVEINGGTVKGGIYMQHGESWYYADPAANRLNVNCELEINGGDIVPLDDGYGHIRSRLSNPDNAEWSIAINGGNIQVPVQLQVQRGVSYTNGVSGATTPAEATGARNTEWLEKNGGFISGGTFTDIGSIDDVTTNLHSFVAEGFELQRTGADLYTVLASDSEGDKLTADTISIEYKDVTVAGTEGEKTYEVIVKANDDDKINELASVDLTFVYTSAPVTGGNIDFTVAPADKFAMTRYENTNRYMFNYNGVDAFEGTDNAITVATITVTGYGEYSIKTADVATNIVNATTVKDNLVDSYTAAGATDDDLTTGGLVINDDTVVGDDMVGEITDDEIAVPTRTLTINLDFPNAVEDNAKAYQNMKVEITGNIDGVNKTVVYNLGEDEVAMVDGSYVVTEDKLVLNNAYTVTVSGAGYRTARYTVTMTEDKALRFWNNVMDEAQVVEIGKDSSAVNVTFLAGDIVKDNKINIYDLSAVVSYFGTETNTDAYDAYAKYDLNRDGVIDSKDVAYVLVSWNN